MPNSIENEPSGFSQAQLSLAEAQRLINEEARANPDRKKSKGRIRNILSNVNRVVSALEHVGSCHPAAAFVFRVYKGLLKLENDRRENSEQIVILFHSMARTLSILSYLDQVTLVSNDPLTLQLAHVLKGFSVTMEEFGDLSDLYYNKCKQPVVRFLKATEFKGKICYFESCFNHHRTELQQILVIRTEVRTAEMSQGIEQLRINTEMIIARLGEPSSEQEAQAAELVRAYGRDRVLHDKSKLEELSTLVGGGKVSGNTQSLLDTNLDDLLSANMEQFHRKLDSSMSQISDAVNKSKEAILRKLDSGPHEHIVDPDVQAVWKSNNWKLSVKARHFVDELSNHFEDKFRSEAADDRASCSNHWTLPIFSKVMHHPAIGDAIDEDGSGFISVYEVNCFMQDRPDGWSVPEWLVYWAIGWKMNNMKYNEAIVDTLEEIKRYCEVAAESDNEDVRHHVQQYLSKITIMEKVSSWSDSAATEDTQDLSHDAEAKLQFLLEESSKQQISIITDRLEELKWILDDPADLPVLLGSSDARIEQLFLAIAHLILGRQLEELASKQLADGDWEIMTETLEMLIGVFHDRMQALLRGWRAQKLNVELHITCFAGGIYNGWYTAYYHPNGEMKRIMEKNPTGHHTVTRDPPQAETLATILTQMGNLTERVDNLDSRIDDILSMLKTLVQAQATAQPAKNDSSVQLPPNTGSSAVPPTLQSPSGNPASQTTHESSTHGGKLASIASHAKTARRVIQLGSTIAKVANKAGSAMNGETPDGIFDSITNKANAMINGDIPDGVTDKITNATNALANGQLPGGISLPNGILSESPVSLPNGLLSQSSKDPTSDGDDLDFIVNDYAADTPGVPFPKMLGAVSRSLLTSPDTKGTLPGQQTLQDYGSTNVVSAEPFNDFYKSTLSKGVSLDPSGVLGGHSPAWPSSAALTKTFGGFLRDGPQSAPILHAAEDMTKKLRHKKSDTSGGFKGVKDSIRQRLTSFGSKGAKNDDRDRESVERSRATSSAGHATSMDSTHRSKSQEFKMVTPLRPDIDRSETSRYQWDTREQQQQHGGREQRDAQPGVARSPDEVARAQNNRGMAQRSEGPVNWVPQSPQPGVNHHRPQPGSPAPSVSHPSSPRIHHQPYHPGGNYPPAHHGGGSYSPAHHSGGNHPPAHHGGGNYPPTHHGGGYQPTPPSVNYQQQGRGGTENVNYGYPATLHRSDGAAAAVAAPAPNQPRARHPNGMHSATGSAPAWRNGWNGSPQWEGQKQAPTYGTAH